LRFRSVLAGLEDHRELIITAVMIVLVFLFAFTALAFPISDDPVEDQETEAMASWGEISMTVPFVLLLLAAALTSGFSGMSLVPECLSSHIGEKRFADAAAGYPVFALLFGCSVTALFGVPSLFYSCRRSWNSGAAGWRFSAIVPLLPFAGRRNLS
jgi:hypothetical protein